MRSIIIKLRIFTVSLKESALQLLFYISELSTSLLSLFGQKLNGIWELFIYGITETIDKGGHCIFIFYEVAKSWYTF